MNPANRGTSHVPDAAPKKGEIKASMKQVADAHRRIMPLKGLHPWRRWRGPSPSARPDTGRGSK